MKSYIHWCANKCSESGTKHLQSTPVKWFVYYSIATRNNTLNDTLTNNMRIVSMKRSADRFRSDVTVPVTEDQNSGACMSRALLQHLSECITHAHKNFKFLSLTFSCYQESVVTSQQWLQIRLSSLLIFLRNKCVYCSCSYFPTQTIMSHSRLREVLLPLFLAGFFRVAHEYICGRGTSLSAVTL